MLVQIKSRWSSRIVFETEVGASLETDGLRLGAAVRIAYKSGADLSGAVLRGADLSGAVLRGADLSGAVLRTSSKSPARKAASAMIAKIPTPLAKHIGTTYWPTGRAA